jgi:molybdenum cofactor synthesis domain-containing protein
VSAAVLIIGNEILSGRTQDTNLAHLAKTLNDYGIQVLEARVVPDLSDEIVASVNALRARYDYVFTTGGIGPTHDDITAACIAKAFNVPLVMDPTIESILRKREAPPDIMEMRLRMARIPQGAGLIENPQGPHGFYIQNVYVMAGIPAVMQAMLGSLNGKLKRGQTIETLSVTAYLAESTIARQLEQIQNQFPHIDLGSYPFYKNERYGTVLVMRGSERGDLEAVQGLVQQMVEGLGGG